MKTTGIPRRLRNRQGSKRKRARRNRVAEAQNWRCAYCGCDLDIDTATTEHVIPVCQLREAALGDENCVVACSDCNWRASRFLNGFVYFRWLQKRRKAGRR